MKRLEIQNIELDSNSRELLVRFLLIFDNETPIPTRIEWPVAVKTDGSQDIREPAVLQQQIRKACRLLGHHLEEALRALQEHPAAR